MYGGKSSKKILTLLVWLNASDPDKVALLLMGNAIKPRCFYERAENGLDYWANKKSWMTMQEFFD